MKIHIKRMDLFAVLTLTNDAGRTFVTTMNRGITKDDTEVQEMVRRFKRGKKVVNTDPVKSKRDQPNRPRSYRTKKRGVGTGNNEQGVLV